MKKNDLMLADNFFSLMSLFLLLNKQKAYVYLTIFQSFHCFLYTFMGRINFSVISLFSMHFHGKNQSPHGQ